MVLDIQIHDTATFTETAEVLIKRNLRCMDVPFERPLQYKILAGLHRRPAHEKKETES
jgi:hypothetical protein